MPLAEDTILEKRYRIDGLLARGGMGAIYRAFDTNLKTPVAIKENYFQTPERIAQFKQEAFILARLRHAALPRVIHHFSTGGREPSERKQYLVMDFIEGENLWEIVQRTQQAVPEQEALNYLIQVCQAVSYLHAQSPPIIHRDIKPQNIKITPEGQAVLVDFGIAKQVTRDNSPTLVGAQSITPGFSPPEQYRGVGTTPASDVYSLGATLYAVLTAQIPPTSISLMAGKFKPPDKINPRLTPQVAEAVMQAMQIEPDDRPPSAAAWQKRLEAVANASARLDSAQDPIPAGTSLESGQKVPQVEASIPASSGTATCWLVDATGRGYPIQKGSQVIGRHSTADIVVEDLSVSRNHAFIRVEGGRCQVRDNDSANGTFLNGRRLDESWYPVNAGDLLLIGSVRFYLTTTQPAKLAPPKSEPESAPEIAARPPASTAPALSPAKSKPRSNLLRGLVVILGAGLLGLVGYGLANPALVSTFWGQTATIPEPAPAVESTVEEERVTSIPVETEIALEAELEATATPASLLDAPAVGSLTPEPDASALGSTVERLSLQTRTPSPTVSRAAPTATPSPTPSPSGTPTGAAPVSAGPTLIPLQADERIARIGPREVIDVDINPNNPREVYTLVKGDGLYKSSTGGDGPWTKMEVDGSSLVAFVIDPTNPTRFYAPTWNAVLKSTDGGNTWQANMTGLVANRTVDVLAVNPADPDRLYAGIGENLVVSTDGGETWSSQAYGQGLGVAEFYALVVDPFNPDLIYVGGLAASIYKSSDGGRSFIQLPTNTGLGTFGLAANPARKEVYLAGINSSEAGVIKTENGFEFHSVSTGLIYGGADSAYSALIFAPGNPEIVYAGSGYESNPDAKGIFKSTDGGETWSRVNNGLSINPDTDYPYYVKTIAVHPTNPDVALAATGGGLFKTVNGGASWSLQ